MEPATPQPPPVEPPVDQPATPSANRGIPTGQIYSSTGDIGSPQPEMRTPAIPQTKPPKAPEDTEKDNRKTLISTVALLLMAPVIAWGISSYGIQSYQVSGHSMINTLQDKDRLIIDKFPRTFASLFHHQYVPKRGTIIILNEPGNPNEQLVKRVIGLPGERVVVHGALVTVFNSANPKGFHPDTSGQYQVQPTKLPIEIDVTLNSDEIFVCGDNRDNSRDSRYFGPVNVKDIVGKLSYRIMPFNKFHHF